VQTAAQADVPPEKAGLAAALINASFQVGAALGLAIFSVIAASRTHHLLAGHASRAAAATGGYQRAILVSAVFLVAAALIATRAPNTRGEQIVHEHGQDTEPNLAEISAPAGWTPAAES
jgi:hypothetical protein